MKIETLPIKINEGFFVDYVFVYAEDGTCVSTRKDIYDEQQAAAKPVE